MKNKIILMLTALSALFVSCTTNEYEAPGDISAVGFYTSTGTSEEIKTALFGYTTFSDLSQGVIDHSWTIDEGNFFLKGPISFRENKNDFESKIINPGSTVTNDKTAIVYFKKAGYQKVRLYNTFDKFVNFRGARLDAITNKKVEYDFPAKQVGDKWVIDTTFVVKVYDTITPKVIVRRKDGVILKHNEAKPIIIEAGESLTFEDISTLGEPTDRYWFARVKGTLTEIANSRDVKTDLIFNRIGDFVAGITASRNGDKIPFGIKTKIFRMPIKVIASTKPFELVTIEQAIGNKIKIQFSGEFASFDTDALDFKVLVNSTEAGIQSVSLDNSNPTTIVIKLLDKIISSDEIKVSLIDPKGVQSVDERDPIKFTDEIVEMLDTSVAFFNFDGVTNSNWTPITFAANTTTDVSFSTSVFSSPTHSLKLENTVQQGGKWTGFENLVNTFALKKGKKYKIEYKIYKAAGAVINMNGPFINGLEGQGNYQFWNNAVKTAPINTWVTVKPNQVLEVENDSPTAHFFFRHNGKGVIYVDDIKIYELEER